MAPITGFDHEVEGAIHTSKVAVNSRSASLCELCAATEAKASKVKIFRSPWPHDAQDTHVSFLGNVSDGNENQAKPAMATVRWLRHVGLLCHGRFWLKGTRESSRRGHEQS